MYFQFLHEANFDIFSDFFQFFLSVCLEKLLAGLKTYHKTLSNGWESDWKDASPWCPLSAKLQNKNSSCCSFLVTCKFCMVYWKLAHIAIPSLVSLGSGNCGGSVERWGLPQHSHQPWFWNYGCYSLWVNCSVHQGNCPRGDGSQKLQNFLCLRHHLDESGKGSGQS